jgi:hypothetical protein
MAFKECTDENMWKLHKRIPKILDWMKENNPEDMPEPTSLEALILGIFEVFNPENVPMSDKDVGDFVAAYQTFFKEKVLN